MNNDQNECKSFPRDEKGYYDVPDVHEKHCPTCAYSGKCYVDDVHSWPWTTSECVNAGYIHYRPNVKAVTDGTAVDTVEHLGFMRSGRSLLQKAIVDEAKMHMPDHFVLCSEEEFDERFKAWKDKVFQLTKEVEHLKVDNDRLRKSRNCGQWIAIKHPYTNSHGTCEVEDEFHCPFCNVASDSRTNFCSNCGSYLRGVIDEQV